MAVYTTTLAKKIETGTHVTPQARACSRDHAPVPAGAWLSQFFGQGSITVKSWRSTVSLSSVKTTQSGSWPAMRVISLGIRTVPVLSVAKKLAAPRPSSDSTCRQHVPADEGAWSGLTVDSVLKNFGLVFFFFSLLEVMTGRGELTECSKLTCFAKRMLDMVPGDSGKWDRRSLSATIRDRRRTCQVESELGKGKNRPNTTYPSSKEEEKASSTHKSKFTNESKSRTESDVRSTNCCVHACMHYAQLRSCSACFVSVELGLSNDSF